MKRLSYFFLLALVACAPHAHAQTRPAATPTPAPQTPAPPSAAAAPAPTQNACGCEDKPLPEVLAVVNGIRITRQDIGAQTQQRIEQLQQEVTDARKRELDMQINSLLLEAEAKKRGINSVKLLEDEVIAKFIHPTDADVQTFFDQNKARIEAQAGRPVELKEVKENILNFLREQRQQEEAKKLADRLRAASDVKVLVPEATPPATPAERSRLFATVNGRRITSGDIEDSLRPLIYSVQDQVYTLRTREVDLKINDILLSQEAQKRGVTTNSLLETEVAAKVPTVTEAQAQAFYNENKDRINGEFAQLKEQIIQYLKEDEARKTETAFAARLRQAASVQTFLTAPEPPRYDIATDDQPTKGNPSATVTVVEFTDFQCPSCAQTHTSLERLMAEMGDRVKFVLRDYPLTQHANAFKAAEAAEAAREQGKFWDYITVLYRNQSALETDKLKQYATALGLDRAKFDAALDGGKFKDKVQRDLIDGQKLGINATPTLFVNGVRMTDRTYEALKAAIESALKKAPAAK
ncbi:MAG TPA: thioredoxin domain-containing protein [Pyrinomonadaceae bacterium]|nr:thioredoxin domain-containing protein [Pyrinomonadaceae bacterium]